MPETVDLAEDGLIKGTMLIRGELTFDGGATDLGGAAVTVRVIDAGRLDAAAVPVEEVGISELPRATTSAEPIPFQLQVAPPVEHQRYILWARVDRDRDGLTSRGDYITMQEYPVGPGPTGFYRLRLRRVG